MLSCDTQKNQRAWILQAPYNNSNHKTLLAIASIFMNTWEQVKKSRANRGLPSFAISTNRRMPSQFGRARLLDLGNLNRRASSRKHTTTAPPA